MVIRAFYATLPPMCLAPHGLLFRTRFCRQLVKGNLHCCTHFNRTISLTLNLSFEKVASQRTLPYISKKHTRKMTGRVTRHSLRLKEAQTTKVESPLDPGGPADSKSQPKSESKVAVGKAEPKATSRAGSKSRSSIEMKSKPQVQAKTSPKDRSKPSPMADTVLQVKRPIRKSGSDTPKSRPRKVQSPPPKEQQISEELKEAMAALKKSEEALSKFNMNDIKQLKTDFGKAITKAKRETQERELRNTVTKTFKSTRSGLKRGATKHHEEYTEGKYINIGMDAVSDTLNEEDLEYLKNEVDKVKQVKDLKFDHLKYLIHFVFYDELKGIQSGEVKSDFHDRYMELIGESKKELQCEIRTTLFTNEQRDYMGGYLQELFDCNKKEANGDLKHNLINYVETVIRYEAVVRIVKFVHGFDSFDETLAFMKSKSFETYGISDDEDN